MEVHQKTVPIQ